MSINRVILLLGSSVLEQEKFIEKANQLISKNLGLIKKVGTPQKTEPIGFTSTHSVLNQILEIECTLSPTGLLKEIKRLETQLGRAERKPKPGEQFSNREIDIDILFFNSVRFESQMLNIPHLQVKTRNFVKEMLVEFNENTHLLG